MLPARGRPLIACLALLLIAEAPAPSTGVVQEVPRDQALAVLGQTVADTTGKTIGRLVDVLVDASGDPAAAVIDFGGFMGVGSRKIAVQWSALHFSPADPKTPIILQMSQDQIKAAPEYKNVTQPAPVVVPPPVHASTAVDEVPPSPR